MQSPLQTHKDVLMTETWLTSTNVVKLAELKPGDYELKGNPRRSGMIGGGIDIIFKTGIKWNVLSSGDHNIAHLIMVTMSYCLKRQHWTFVSYIDLPTRTNIGSQLLPSLRSFRIICLIRFRLQFAPDNR